MPNFIKIGGGREFHWLISYGMTLTSFEKIGGQWIFGGASDFSNLLAPWASDSRSLMLRAAKSVSVYRHVAGVSAAAHKAHNEVDPTRGVY